MHSDQLEGANPDQREPVLILLFELFLLLSALFQVSEQQPGGYNLKVFNRSMCSDPMGYVQRQEGNQNPHQWQTPCRNGSTCAVFSTTILMICC